MMYDELVAITENRKVNQDYWKLSFHSPKLAQGVRAGQFINVQLEKNSDPFLRRPFSYYRVVGNQVEILYEILGRGTQLLTYKQKGDQLKVLGPLGKPFTAKMGGARKRILVAGGVGVPPLVFLAEQTAVDYLLIGCKSKGEVLPKKEFARVKAKVMYTTEDSSYGTKGFVTVLLREIIDREKNPKSIFIQTCGPHAMMNAVMKLASEFGIEGEASIDERMACGVGACLGCMVKTRDGYKTSCIEGPVFQFGELVHD
ncbi:MAG: dihydroorotate dehydrogenase electron transfer subunit [Candidatus Omnitrophica bacterium]|nr:dihydroorotate dehydrogenase electron transfer subunit [Candidatus Omnitrophota bacterium]